MDSVAQKARIVSSLLWSLMQRSGVQALQLLIILLLARILLPEDFGLVVLVTFFNTFAIILIQSGFTTGLIQKKSISAIDLSSVFYVNILCSVLLYIILFIFAPFIAAFFEQPPLTLIIRVLSLSFFFSSFHSIQYVIISRHMQFKALFKASFIAHTLSGIIGIGLAYVGAGVWALVIQQLTSYILNPLILFFYVKWRPILRFSFTHIAELFSFGWKILVSSLMHTFYIHLLSMMVGKLFNPALVGFYNRGEQMPSVIVSNINGSIQSVMLPALSSLQDNRQRVRDMVRRTILTSSFIVFPMLAILFVVAEPLIQLLLTDKWLASVPFLQIFCIAYACMPLQTANAQVINALGRSDIFLKLEILNTCIGVFLLLLAYPYGIFAMTFALLVSNVIAAIVGAAPNKHLIHYSFYEQLKDVVPALVMSLVMAMVIYPLQWLDLSLVMTLMIQISSGVIIYLCLARLFKVESYQYLLVTLMPIVNQYKWLLPWTRQEKKVS